MNAQTKHTLGYLTIADAQRVHVGWSGNSKPMYELWAPCGCRFGADGKDLRGACHAHAFDSSITNIRLSDAAITNAGGAP